MTITAVTGKPFKLVAGKYSFISGGTGDITVTITAENGSSTSSQTITPPIPYTDELANCTVVPTFPAGATLDVATIEQY